MGRSNGIGTISENGQCGKSHSMKTILPKKGNNNKNYKKNSKGSSQSNQDHEQVLQANVETNMSSKTLDYQNGNIYEIHKSNHADIHSSSKTTPKKVIEQKSRTLKVSSSQGKEASNSETKKEVFHFWSTKVNNIHEGSEEKTSVAKSSAGDHLKNIITNQPADSTQEDHGRGCDFSKNPFEIRPLKRKKRDELFPPVGFTHIDDYVLSLSNQIQSQNASVKEIVHKITKKSTNNIEKIRAIWIWLCHNISYDVEGYLGLSQKLYRPEDVLEKRKAVCSGYAGLCKEMCREIGIRCREISGFSRGAENSGSASFHRTKSNHMWNAVEMAGEWLLLDACWGAGTVDLQKAIFLPSYDDFFFLTAPEEFIETHWPDDPSWQLLERPVSFKDFQQKIFKTSEFFRLSLTVTTPEAFYLTTEDGEVKVSLSYQYPMEFSYKIYKLSNDSRIFVEKTFGILTNQESCMTLRVFPPMDGQYELMVFARPTGTTAPYKWVCSYHIDCPQPKSSLALPENPFHFWGLHQTGKDLGVTSCNPGEDLIVSETSPLNIIFKTSRALMATFQLAHQEMAEPFSKKCLVSQIEETQLRCKVLLPFHGYYRLSLFVKKLEGEHFQNVSNMLINCRNPVNHNELFPLNLSTHCGPGTNTRQHGLTSPSHTSPVISTRTGKCRITFCTLWDLEVFTVLENGRETKSLCPLDRYCLLTQVEQKICLTVHLPEAGQYKLSIFTKPQRAQEFSHACDYVIRCHSNQGLPPFQTFTVRGGAAVSCCSHKPASFPRRVRENFRVKIPGACKVLVIGPVKTELQLTKSTVWEGKVFTGTAGSLIKLAVKFSSNSAEMDIVMSFKTQKTRLDTSSG